MLNLLGVRIGPQWENPLWRRGEILRRYGVNLVLDVGANAGQYGLSLRHEARYRGRILSFEPVAEPFAVLQQRSGSDGAWTCSQLALSDRDGTAEITIAAASECSSFLPFQEVPPAAVPGAVPIGSRTVSTARLDTVAPVGPGDVAMLKLDVQGSEPQVLAGAVATMPSVFLVECELAFERLYKTQPTVREMIDLFDDLGFHPISVAPGPIDFETASLTYVDAILARSASP
jgi:FkbM family methyltransferase